jgi:hypothetical protein
LPESGVKMVLHELSKPGVDRVLVFTDEIDLLQAEQYAEPEIRRRLHAHRLQNRACLTKRGYFVLPLWGEPHLAKA